MVTFAAALATAAAVVPVFPAQTVSTGLQAKPAQVACYHAGLGAPYARRGSRFINRDGKTMAEFHVSKRRFRNTTVATPAVCFAWTRRRPMRGPRYVPPPRIDLGREVVTGTISFETMEKEG